MSTAGKSADADVGLSEGQTSDAYEERRTEAPQSQSLIGPYRCLTDAEHRAIEEAWCGKYISGYSALWMPPRKRA